MPENTEKSLQLTRPFGQVFIWTLFFLMALCGLLEGLARSDVLKDRIPPPALDTGYIHLEAKWYALQGYQAQHGPVDCFFLGSSMVHNGLDPERVVSAYQAQSGKTLRCYNFGLGGVSAHEAGLIATILVEQYHPRLIVYGTSIRDYSLTIPWSSRGKIEASAWGKYRLGEANMNGWLGDRSAAYASAQGGLLWFQQPSTWRRIRELEERLSAAGFVPQKEKIFDPDAPLAPEYRKSFEDFAISVQDWEGLQVLMAFKQQGITVILLEMPLPEVYWKLLEEGEQTYLDWRGEMESAAKAVGVPFWRTIGEEGLADVSYSDVHHVDSAGATLLSDWLGLKLFEEWQ